MAIAAGEHRSAAHAIKDVRRYRRDPDLLRARDPPRGAPWLKDGPAPGASGGPIHGHRAMQSDCNISLHPLLACEAVMAGISTTSTGVTAVSTGSDPGMANGQSIPGLRFLRDAVGCNQGGGRDGVTRGMSDQRGDRAGRAAAPHRAS